MQNVITVKCKYLGEEEYITKDGSRKKKHKWQDHTGRYFDMNADFDGIVGEYYPVNIVLLTKWNDDTKRFDKNWFVAPFHPDNLENR